MAGPILSIQDLSFFYPDGTRALDHISLDVQSNEILVIFGPSRSGKTTLLRLLNRLSDQIEGAKREGAITFHDRDIFARDVDVTRLRRRISMVFAVPTPLPGTIFDNMCYGLKMAGERNRDILNERVELGLRQAALWDEVKDRLDSSAFALSGGQKQRLCLARCLALTSSSARHSSSARSSAPSSTRRPWRSYLFLALLHFKTTAQRTEYFLDRRVRAALPAGRKTR